MKSLESYQHSRNYGCRVKEFEMQGISALSLENNLLKVVFLPGKGCDIVEFLYKPLDIDVMWHSFNQPKPMPAPQKGSGGFADVYFGGWQDLFPTIGAPSNFYGAPMDQHGETVLLPWSYRIIIDTIEEIKVVFSVQCTRSPFFRQKTVSLRLDSTTLSFEESIVNQGQQTLSFAWGQHPAVGPAFLDDTCQIYLGGQATVVTSAIDYGKEYSQLPVSLQGAWPLVEGKQGKVNLSQVHHPSEKVYNEFGLVELEEPSYVIYNPSFQLGFGMKWDKEMFPNLWVWQMYAGGMDYPFFGRAYCLALEPWSALGSGFDNTYPSSLCQLKGGESLHTTYTAFVQTECPNQ